MDKQKIILIIVLLVIGGLIFRLEKEKPKLNSETPMPTLINPQSWAPEITNPSGFLNTDGIKIHDLIGKKVVLVDFWTYSCINCQRTLPYLNAWYDKYKDKGLEIIGIHTPEFDFEKDRSNVQEAIEKYGIKYPVVQDNDFGTWRAYGNRYWPHKYLIDLTGAIVYDHIGEGGYDETEKQIQELLKAGDMGIAQPEGLKPMSSGPRSPEIYFGSERNEFLGNGQRGKTGVQTFKAPEDPKPNTLYLVGQWDLQPEYAQALSQDAKIIFKYQGAAMYMVASSEKSVSVSLMRDGKDYGSPFNIQNEDLYILSEQPEEGQHLMEIKAAPGLKAFTFTFG
jgi:thiol-disulfide isomerase/thioredoxin